MIVLLHITIAIASILCTGYTYISPSKSTLRVAYALVVGTFVSGTYGVIAKPAHLMPACMMGLAYLGVVGFGIIAARYKLVRNSLARPGNR